MRAYGASPLSLVAYLCVCALCSAFAPAQIRAEVFLAQDEALKQAFPEAEAIERRTIVLNAEEVSQIEGLAEAKLNSQLLTLFEGKIKGETKGFAVIETDIVRSQHQTYMVVISLQGKVEKVVVLAFNEPPEYLASANWLRQFFGVSEPQEARIGGKIAGIVGSTLTSEGIATGVRRAVAALRILKITRGQ